MGEKKLEGKRGKDHRKGWQMRGGDAFCYPGSLDLKEHIIAAIYKNLSRKIYRWYSAYFPLRAITCHSNTRR